MDAAKLESVCDGISAIISEPTLPERQKTLLIVARQLLSKVAEMPHTTTDVVKRSLQQQAFDRSVALLDVTDYLTPRKVGIHDKINNVLNECYLCLAKLEREAEEDAK